MARRERNIIVVPRKQVSGKRLILFRTITFLLPSILLVLFEFTLRIFNYGYNPRLFISYPPDESFMSMNPRASYKFFTDQASATTGNVEPFRKEKDPNTLRIFVLGESTTIGYPYFHNGSFHRWLQYRLMRSLPDKNIEIINCALTAVNSYTVLDFAQQVVDYQPDAVLIYAGHNEYYGALGVGSTGNLAGSPRLVRLMMWLRSLKVGQLITGGYQKIVHLFGSKNANTGKRRMEVMAAEQHIPYGGDLFNRGIEQFASNMDATLKLFNNKKVPVFISNLVSNEKDQTPFLSDRPDTLNAVAFKSNYQQGLEAYRKGNFSAAEKYLLQANNVFSTHAGCNFYLGKLSYAKGEVAQAKAYFSRAKDLDALRFRAPHQLNDEIIRLCNKYRSNTHYVDTKAAFEAWSRHSIMGNELILEHVHPNLLGYALLSDAFYQSMKLYDFFSLKGGQEMSFRQLLQDMPVTRMDSLAGAYRVAALRKGWPFNEANADSVVPKTDEEKLAYDVAFKRVGWEEAMDHLYNKYIAAHDLRKAGTILQGMVLEHPREVSYYERAANVYGELNDYDNAIFYFRKTFEISPSVNTARYLFVLYFRIDKPVEAMPFLQYAISNGGGGALITIEKLAKEIIQLQKKSSADVIVYSQIAEKYKQMGNSEGALKYAQLAAEKKQYKN